MAQKKAEEKVAPRVCVCGKKPVIVKHKGRYMATCPDTTRCAMRTGWRSNEQQAIKDWNVEIMSKKHST